MDAYGFDPNRPEVDRQGKRVARCSLCRERIREDSDGAIVNGAMRHTTPELCIARLQNKIAHLKEANAKYGVRQQQRGKYMQQLLQKQQENKQRIHVLKQLVYRNQKALHDAGLPAIYATDSNTFVAESHDGAKPWKAHEARP